MKDDGSYDLREALEDLEDELIASMKRNLARHEAEEEKEGFRWEMWQKAKLRRLREFREDNQRIIEEYKPRIKDVIWDTIKNAYAKGKSIIKSLLSRLSIGFPEGNTSPLTEDPPPENDFFGINRARIEVLQSEAEEPANEIQEQVQSDMDRATPAMWRRMDDVYRKTIYKAGIFLNAGGMSLNQAIDQATKDFLAKGIDCIEYKNGNRVNIASYAEMALRTAAHRATLAAEGKERDRLGIHTVIVSAHANTCELCAPWQAKILVDDVFSSGTAEEARELGYPLLSEAIKAGLLHPNCRHTITTYIPGVTQIPKIPDEKKAAETYSAEQKQRALERQIRKWKRIAEGSLDEKNIKYAKDKLRGYQADIRKLLADHPELRRNYSREKTRGISSNLSDFELKSAIIKSELRKVGVTGKINIIPRNIDVESLKFDNTHINEERGHGVTEVEAKDFIRNAKISITKWNGKYERYYSASGIAYVDLENKLIRTAFKPEEFMGDAVTIIEVLKKYG